MERIEKEHGQSYIEKKINEEIDNNRREENKLKNEILFISETPQEILGKIWDVLPDGWLFWEYDEKREINYINRNINVFKKKSHLLYSPKEYGKINQYEYSDITIQMHKQWTDKYLYVTWTKKNIYDKKSKKESFNIKETDGKFFLNDGDKEFTDHEYLQEKLTEVYDIIEKIKWMRIDWI